MTIELFFSEYLLKSLSDSLGSIPEKMGLLISSIDSDTVPDMTIVPPDFEIIKKTTSLIQNTTENTSVAFSSKIKKIDKKWKKKKVALTGNLGSSTELLGSEQTDLLFVDSSPNELLSKTLFEKHFNTNTNYFIHPIKEWPEDILKESINIGTMQSTFLSASTSDLLFGNTVPNVFQTYTGTYVEYLSGPDTCVLPLDTNTDLLVYASGTNANSSTCFYYSSETGIFYSTFYDFIVSSTSKDVLSGYILTANNQSSEIIDQDTVTTSTPTQLILYTVKFSPPLKFPHQSREEEPPNFSVLKFPKISLSMDVIII